MSGLRLYPDLIPATAIGHSLCSLMGWQSPEWRQVRQAVLADARYQCAICHARGPLDCDEVWTFDDGAGVQRLDGCRALCQDCHRVKHWGLTRLLIFEKKLPEGTGQRLVDHFRYVNGVSRERFAAAVTAAYAVYHERSKRRWQLDCSEVLRRYLAPDDAERCIELLATRAKRTWWEREASA